jgi:arabinogalactan endo-1,4-beta-galactosidase
MVQIGNEITPGMVWPDGRLGDTGPDNNWPNFTDLIKAGIRGVEESLEGAPRPGIMLQIDRGGDLPATKHFFDKIREYGVEYDVIGQSFYPWWHGSLLDLKENLDFMAMEYGKEIILVEVAYHWKENGEYGQSPTPFPQTPEGQKEFLESIHRLLLATPNGLGKGIFWWEPAVPLRPAGKAGIQTHDWKALSWPATQSGIRGRYRNRHRSQSTQYAPAVNFRRNG